jgi:hypothetical protein
MITVRVQYRNVTVYVTLDEQQKLIRANLGGDYLDITDKLNETDTKKLIQKAIRVTDQKMKKENRKEELRRHPENMQ